MGLLEWLERMRRFLKHQLLPMSVFITGACVLVIEIVAVRVLSPYFGSTIFTVSSVISVILVALSIGYYVGGRFADRHPSLHWFFGIILVSGLLVLLIHFLSLLVLPILSLLLSLAAGPLVASVVLFLVPALLLGTLSPYAIKLQTVLVPEQGIGSVSGVMFFWSTLGSIVGSLLAGFVLIPALGIDSIFIATGSVLFLLGLIPLMVLGLTRKQFIKATAGFVMLVSISTATTMQIEGAMLYSTDGVYEKILIYDDVYQGRPIRMFQQDRSASGAMFLDSDNPTDLVFDYTKYYSLYKLFQPDVKEALVIGGGAYSIPKALQAELPEARVTVSEIEPSLFALAQEYFDVEPNERLVNSTVDGRRLLRESEQAYDLIFSDVYYSLYSVPAHFTTVEFFELAKEKLAPDGVFIANLIGNLSRQEPSLIFSELNTFRQVFPNSYFFAVDSPKRIGTQNIIFVGYNSGKTIDFMSPAVINHEDLMVSTAVDKLIDVTRFELTPYSVMTDNYAPVDYLTSKVVERDVSQETAVDGAEMLALISQQLRYGPRYIGAPGHTATQEFLAAEMRLRADEVLLQSWNYEASDGVTYELTNVMGRFNPEAERRILLGTHFDSKRLADKDWWKSEEPVPGANDSASGVAVLLELARIFNATDTNLPIGVDLVFFDGEEGDPAQGSDYTDWVPLGSTHFAQNIKAIYGEEKPTSALILDMVCDADLKIYQEASSVENAPAVVEQFWSVAREVDETVFVDDVGPSVRDDHTPLNEIGIPSALVIDFTYPPFHTTKDTLDKCSEESLETVTTALYEYLYSVE